MSQTNATTLDPKSSAILWMLAGGFSIDELLNGHSEISREDISAAAKQALEIASRPEQATQSTNYVDVVRKTHPHAYAPWTDEQDEALIRLHSEGISQTKIANELGRRPNAIAKRIEKLKADGRLNETTSAASSGSPAQSGA